VIFFPLEMQVIKRWVLDMQCHNLAVEWVTVGSGLCRPGLVY
jgi:hypothetical protein